MKLVNILYFGLAIAVLSFLSNSTHAQHLHAFIVVDTDDDRIGDSVGTDGINLYELLDRGLDESSYTDYVLTGIQVTPDNILRTLKDAKIKPEDSVLFYYSGHGAFDRNTQDHYLTLGNNKVLARSKVRQAVFKHNPKLAVFISDCCANMVRLPTTDAPDAGAGGLAAGMAMRTTEYPVLRHLFFNTKGLVDITSSRPGQISVGFEDGGLFTNAVLSTIEENSHKAMNWFELFTQSRARTSEGYEISDGIYRSGFSKGMADGQNTQTAWTFQTMYGVNPNNQRLGLFMDLEQAGVITKVNQGSVAQVAGLEAGDRIQTINGNSFNTTAEALKMVGNSKRDLRLVVQCVRTGKYFQFNLKLPY